MTTDSPKTDSGVLLSGAAPIAKHLFGDDSRKNVRRVYGMAEKCELPIFKLNGKLTARPAALDRAIEERERAAYAHTVIAPGA